MTTPHLQQAIDRFIATARDKNNGGENGPFVHRITTGQQGRQTIIEGVPGEPRILSAEDARSDFRGEVCALVAGGVRFVHCAYEGRGVTEFTLDSEYLGVHYTSRGERTYSVNNAIIARAQAGDYVFAINKSPLLKLSVSDNFTGLSVFIPIPAAQRFSLRSRLGTEEEGLKQYLEHGLVVSGPSSIWGAHLAYALDHAVELSSSGVDTNATSHLLDEYLYLIFCQELATQAQLRDTDQQYVAIPLALKTAEAFVIDNVVRAPSVKEVAVEAGLSVRSLHTLFVKFRGMSPSEFIRERRLIGIRNALRHAKSNATISEVATFWGYHNFGNFAAAYKKRFGELPSETLGRAE
ncbi:MAG: AraC family transcriptional regulator [Alphaproteobacteria bacterium]|nr:AraC family transcriptional regulator [Alphaproteobacteria bacterium]